MRLLLLGLGLFSWVFASAQEPANFVIEDRVLPGVVQFQVQSDGGHGYAPCTGFVVQDFPNILFTAAHCISDYSPYGGYTIRLIQPRVDLPRPRMVVRHPLWSLNEILRFRSSRFASAGHRNDLGAVIYGPTINLLAILKRHYRFSGENFELSQKLPYDRERVYFSGVGGAFYYHDEIYSGFFARQMGVKTVERIPVGAERKRVGFSRYFPKLPVSVKRYRAELPGDLCGKIYRDANANGFVSSPAWPFRFWCEQNRFVKVRLTPETRNKKWCRGSGFLASRNMLSTSGAGIRVDVSPRDFICTDEYLFLIKSSLDTGPRYTIESCAALKADFPAFRHSECEDGISSIVSIQPKSEPKNVTAKDLKKRDACTYLNESTLMKFAEGCEDISPQVDGVIALPGVSPRVDKSLQERLDARVERVYRDLKRIRFDAQYPGSSINPGNSGGPIFKNGDFRHEVFGLATAVSHEGTFAINHFVSFANPENQAFFTCLRGHPNPRELKKCLIGAFKELAEFSDDSFSGVKVLPLVEAKILDEEICSLGWAGSHSLLVIGCRGTVVKYDLEKLMIEDLFKIDPTEYREPRFWQLAQNRSLMLRYLPKQKGSPPGEFMAVRDGRVLYRSHIQLGPFNAAYFAERKRLFLKVSMDEKYGYGCDSSGQGKIFTLEEGAEVAAFDGASTRNTRDLSLSPKNDFLVLADPDGQIRVFPTWL